MLGIDLVRIYLTDDKAGSSACDNSYQHAY